MTWHEPTLILVGLTILPPLAYLLWVRNMETSGREPMGQVLRSFVFGAIVGAGLALVLNTLFNVGAVYYAQAATGLGAVFLTVVVAAPFIEEATKAIGLGRRRPVIDQLQDGIVYGTAIGLGFATTENLLYGFSAFLDEGFDVAGQTIVMRTLSAMLLHGATTALIGFGYARMVRQNSVVAVLIPYYLVAVLAHAAYNFLVLTDTLYGFLAAVLLAMLLSYQMHKTIRRLDALPHTSRA